MLVSLWSLKGGVGCSVTAALLALHHARDPARDRVDRGAPGPAGAVLVDVTGDLPAVLGCPAPAAGLADWMRAGAAGPPDGLARVAVDVAPGLALIGRGSGPWPDDDPADVLARQLEAFPGTVVVDAGVTSGSTPAAAIGRWFAARADRSILVTTACYLALVRAVSAPVQASGVIVVREAGRALDNRSVEDATGAPVVAEIARDVALARAVDAGLLLARVPKGLHRVMGAVT